MVIKLLDGKKNVLVFNDPEVNEWLEAIILLKKFDFSANVISSLYLYIYALLIELLGTESFEIIDPSEMQEVLNLLLFDKRN